MAQTLGCGTPLFNGALNLMVKTDIRMLLMVKKETR